jgi:hypothetical protein
MRDGDTVIIVIIVLIVFIMMCLCSKQDTSVKPSKPVKPAETIIIIKDI